MELPSNFDPEVTTQKWNEIIDRKRPVSNRQLFELATDIIRLNKTDFDEYGSIGLHHRPSFATSISGHIEITSGGTTEEPDFNTLLQLNLVKGLVMFYR